MNECIILAGGLGTRLRSVVNDQPKVLAPVNNKPFLYYIIRHAAGQGCKRILISTGYMQEKVQAFVTENFSDLDVVIVTEEEPLGTGGAVMNALNHCQTDDVLVMNGDSLFNIDYARFFELHRSHNSAYSIAIKPMQHFNRYGIVVRDEENRVTAFLEKEERASGNINAGVYIINRPLLMQTTLPQKFSLEKDFMEPYCSKINMFAFPFDAYFIDIGIPEDFEKAQTDFKTLFHED